MGLDIAANHAMHLRIAARFSLPNVRSVATMCFAALVNVSCEGVVEQKA